LGSDEDYPNPTPTHTDSDQLAIVDSGWLEQMLELMRDTDSTIVRIEEKIEDIQNKLILLYESSVGTVGG
jgi:hypothetical protein